MPSGHPTTPCVIYDNMNLSNFYYPKEYKTLFRIGVPITVAQLGLTLQGLADNVMVGQHSTEELAAAGFVNNLFMLIILLNLGYSMGAVSQIGARYTQHRFGEIVSILKSSFFANGVQCLLLMAVMGICFFALPYLGQPAELLPLMKPYFLISLFSLPFLAFSSTFKQFTDSITQTMVSMTIMIIGNVWNIIFNYLMIFGKYGFPEMGIEGAAWATFSSRLVMLILYVLAFFFLPRFKEYSHLWREHKATVKEALLLNRLGWPIAIQMGMETAAFALVAIPLGWMGTTALAAHQVMINVSSLIFLFYIGVGSAVSIRVSNYHGLRDNQGVRHAAHAGYQMIFVLGVILSGLAIIFRNDIGGWFTDSPEVSDVVASMMLPLILYQLGDGVQANYVNALRGLGDVKKLMKYSFIAYIVVSLPLSCLFGVVMEGGAFGIWMGFPFGLSMAAIFFLRRFLKVTRIHSNGLEV